jgi:hypothetical protein
MLSDRSIAQAYRIAFNMRYGRAARNSDADILRWHYRHDSLDPQERIDRVVHRMSLRWTAVRETRAVPGDEPVNYWSVSGYGLQAVEKSND